MAVNETTDAQQWTRDILWSEFIILLCVVQELHSAPESTNQRTAHHYRHVCTVTATIVLRLLQSMEVHHIISTTWRAEQNVFKWRSKVVTGDHMSFSSVDRRLHTRSAATENAWSLICRFVRSRKIFHFWRHAVTSVWECWWRAVWADRCCSPATEQWGLSAVVPVLSLEDRQEQRCNSPGARVRGGPWRVVQRHRGRVVDEQRVDGAGGKHVRATHKTCWRIDSSESSHTDRSRTTVTGSTTLVHRDGPGQWKCMRRRAKPQKLCLVAV